MNISSEVEGKIKEQRFFGTTKKESEKEAAIKEIEGQSFFRTPEEWDKIAIKKKLIII